MYFTPYVSFYVLHLASEEFAFVNLSTRIASVSEVQRLTGSGTVERR